MDNQESEKFAQIIARAWQEEAFKQRLIDNPNAVLEENGIIVPHGITIRVLENTPDVCFLTLPGKPNELSDEMLEQVAGGQSDPAQLSAQYQQLAAQAAAFHNQFVQTLGAGAGAYAAGEGR
jgi:PE family/Nitrile hydratase, alpha chain